MQISLFPRSALVAAGLALIAIAVIALRLPQKAKAPEPEQTISHTIEIRPTGYFPADAVVPINTSVCWVNKDSVPHLPGSNPSVSAFAFQPEEAIQPGAMWCFPFTSVGTWSYGELGEDGLKGTIAVVKPLK